MKNKILFLLLFLILLYSCKITPNIIFKNNRIEEIHYKFSNKSKKYFYNPDGTLKYIKQVKNGSDITKVYYKTGELKGELKLNSKNHGILKEFYKSGNLSAKYHVFSRDTIYENIKNSDEILLLEVLSYHGFQYYENGRKKNYGVIFQGKKNGKWESWSNDGELLNVEIYKNDSIYLLQQEETK